MSEHVAQFHIEKHNRMAAREVVGWDEDGMPLIVAPLYPVRLRADEYADREGMTLERIDPNPEHVTATVPAAAGTWVVCVTDDDEPELFLCAAVAWERVGGSMRVVVFEINEGETWTVDRPAAIRWPDGRVEVKHPQPVDTVRAFLLKQNLSVTHIA